MGQLSTGCQSVGLPWNYVQILLMDRGLFVYLRLLHFAVGGRARHIQDLIVVHHFADVSALIYSVAACFAGTQIAIQCDFLFYYLGSPSVVCKDHKIMQSY